MTVETIQLSLRATKLVNVTGVFKGTSDPYAVVTILSSQTVLKQNQMLLAKPKCEFKKKEAKNQ